MPIKLMDAQVASQQDVIKRIISQGCDRKEEFDDNESLAFSKGFVIFFVPKAPDGIGYELELFNRIEQILEYYGVDLLPFDSWLY